MISRDIEDKILAYAKQYPVVTITGPRQSGKTTLAKMIFPDKPYVSLESIEERDFAQNDAKGFLNRFPQGAILDEIQRVPDLLSYLQVLLDESGQVGQFILTGSQNFELLETMNQSLAGRTALVKLLPFSLEEIGRISEPLSSIDALLYNGAYPRIYDHNLNAAHPLRGSLFENLVVSELLKKKFNQGKTDNLYYLRDSKGHEVDILLDYGLHLDMVEIKSSQTLGRGLFGGLHHFRNIYKQTRNCFLVYSGDQDRVQEEVRTIPWKKISAFVVE